MNQPCRYDHPLPLTLVVRDPQRHWPTVRVRTPLGVSLRSMSDAFEQLSKTMREIGAAAQRTSAHLSITMHDGITTVDEVHHWRTQP